jgi:hypothetical protein
MRLGRAKTLALADICMAVGYIPLVSAAPFPAIVVGYFFIGFGFAVNLAIGNVRTFLMLLDPVFTYSVVTNGRHTNVFLTTFKIVLS